MHAQIMTSQQQDNRTTKQLNNAAHEMVLVSRARTYHCMRDCQSSIFASSTSDFIRHKEATLGMPTSSSASSSVVNGTNKVFGKSFCAPFAIAHASRGGWSVLLVAQLLPSA